MCATEQQMTLKIINKKPRIQPSFIFQWIHSFSLSLFFSLIEISGHFYPLIQLGNVQALFRKKEELNNAQKKKKHFYHMEIHNERR